MPRLEPVTIAVFFIFSSPFPLPGPLTVLPVSYTHLKGEKLLIPINMRDGSLICIGKGNPEWNCSAPHGAGRLMKMCIRDRCFIKLFRIIIGHRRDAHQLRQALYSPLCVLSLIHI